MKVSHADDRDVLKLFEPVTWWRRVAAIISKTIPPSVEEYLKNFPAKKMYWDTLSYLEEAYANQSQLYPSDIRAEISEELCRKFDFVRGYHACKPLTSLDSYFNGGLQVLTRERLAQVTYTLFEGSIPIEDLQDRAAHAELTTCEGRIFFVFHPDAFVKGCGHYLIRGPESLGQVWQMPDKSYDPRVHEVHRRYTDRGIPTVFVCNIPIRFMPSIFLKPLSAMLITHHFRNRSKQRSHQELSEDLGFSINENLPAKHIHDHYHPAEIPDPHASYQIYYNSLTSCPWCKKSQS
jgi:hypothetical protein